MSASEDPFDAFGDDDDEEEDTKQSRCRDEACGPLVFRDGTEQALLAHVRNELPSGLQEAAIRERVLELVDQFCFPRHWMMHIGPEKGVILQDFLKQKVRDYTSSNPSQPFVLVEVGTYCGYSTVRIDHTILQELAPTTDFHIFTVDVESKHIAVAKQLVELAGLESKVSFLLLQDIKANPTTLVHTIRTALYDNFPAKPPALDFVFLEHDKDLYHSDLRQLLTSQLIRAGTWVAADNVLFFKLDTYRQYMQTLAASGIVKTELQVGKLEYLNESDEEYHDGLELTMFLKDPPLNNV